MTSGRTRRNQKCLREALIVSRSMGPTCIVNRELFLYCCKTFELRSRSSSIASIIVLLSSAVGGAEAGIESSMNAPTVSKLVGPPVGIGIGRPDGEGDGNKVGITDGNGCGNSVG